MNAISHRRTRSNRRRLSAAVALVGATLLGGCVSYSQSQLASMSTVDLCELQNMQGPNLSPETKQAMQGELSKRKDNCRNHAIELAQRYETFMWREMYGKHDDP